MEGIKTVYEERFGSTNSTDVSSELDHLRELVKRLDQQESILDDSLLELHQYIDQHLKNSESGES